MSRPSSEVEVLADYAYEASRKASMIALWSGRVCVLVSFIALNWIARSRRQSEEIKQVLLSAPKYLPAFLASKTSVCTLVVLPVFYIVAWSFWWFAPESAENSWLYENISLVVSLAYPVFACFWLKRLYLNWVLAHGQSNGRKIGIWTLLVCFAVVGFNKVWQILYQTIFLIYAFLAVSSGLALANLFSQQQGLFVSVQHSLTLSRGHFWDFARLFSSTGFYAYGTIVLNQQLHRLVFERPPVEPIVNVLIHAGLDTIAAFAWLLLDSIILLRGLEYLEMRKSEAV